MSDGHLFLVVVPERFWLVREEAEPRQPEERTVEIAKTWDFGLTLQQQIHADKPERPLSDSDMSGLLMEPSAVEMSKREGLLSPSLGQSRRRGSSAGPLGRHAEVLDVPVKPKAVEKAEPSIAQAKVSKFTDALGKSAPQFIHDGVLDVAPFLKHELKGDTKFISELGTTDPEEKQFLFRASISTDNMVAKLREAGVGTWFGKVYLLPIATLIEPIDPSEHPLSTTSSDEKEGSFLKSVRERGMVENLLDQVELQSRFNFDFLLMTIAASILATCGLALDNAVIIVASMLVSPIMGPILGICFGFVIEDWNLVKRSLKNELIALFICIVVGFFVSLPFIAYAPDLGLPTIQMTDRGEAIGIIYGIAIAIPSGVGVALSVTGSNTPGLVGVAISASLLPPAVNVGFFIAYGALGNVLSNTTVDRHENYLFALFSLLLTIINILIIFLFSIVIFKIKEIAPIPGKSHFWESTVKQLRAQTHNIERNEELKRRRNEHIQELMKQRYPNFAISNVNDTYGPAMNVKAYNYNDTYVSDMLAARQPRISAAKPSDLRVRINIPESPTEATETRHASVRDLFK